MTRSTVFSLLLSLLVFGSLACGEGLVGGSDEQSRNGYSSSLAAEFRAVAPFRRFDTRRPDPTKKRAAKSTYCVQFAGKNGIPSSAAGVVVNLTVTQPEGPGYITAFPRGLKRPTTSNLNYSAGQTVANTSVLDPGTGGEICFYTYARTHLIADVLGYFGASSGYVPLSPFRRFDKRKTPAGDARPRSGSTTCFKVTEQKGIPRDALAVAVNLTAAQATGGGYLTAYPKGSKRPLASNLNYGPGGATANGALVAVGDGGAICVYVHTKTALIVDVAGYLAASADYTPITPLREDTRESTKPTPAKGTHRCFDVAGRGGVGKHARAVAYNLTIVRPQSRGYLRVRPAGRDATTSSLNFAAGDVRANNGVVAVGDDGRVCIYSHATGHWVFDVVGFWPDNGCDPTSPTCASQPLRPMTFNIRVPKDTDGVNRWSNRKSLAVKVITDHDPDVVGMQEVQPVQQQDLLRALPKMAAYGVAADKYGATNVILYRKDRLTLLSKGVVWLNPTATPLVAGWDARYPRNCVWASFARKSDGRAFYFFNAHFDHVGATARLESAKLLVGKIGKRSARDKPVVLVGDLNAGETSPPLSTLKKHLVDTFRVLHPDATNVDTSHGFKGGTKGTKIDYVLVERSTSVEQAQIIHDNTDGRYPSDHYPVNAQISFP